MAEGVDLVCAPDAVVYYERRHRLVPFMVRRFDHGRCFAGMRLAQVPGWRRGAYAVGTLVLPALFLWRIARALLPKRRQLGTLLAVSPIVVAAVVAWAVGELVGYIRGPGTSCTRVL